MKLETLTVFIAVILLGSIGTVMIAAPAKSGQSAIYQNPKEPKVTQMLNLGKLNYDTCCASCHGKTGGGSNKGPTFISRIYHPGHHRDKSFYIAAKCGVRAHHWPFGDMKPVKGISDDQITSIIEYVRAIQKVNGLF
jgi:cytochrome c553